MRNFKKFLALVLAMLMVSACAVSVSAFDDVAAGDKYASAIELLADLGVITGRGDGKFYPNDTLTREEAAVIAAKTLVGATPVEWAAETTKFADVTDKWSFAYINYADKANVMIGTGTNFEPKRELQIDEAIKIALAIADPNALRDATIATAQNPTGYWADYYIKAARAAFLLDDIGTIRNYEAKCSRGMFAQIIATAINKTPDLQKSFGYNNENATVSVDADKVVTVTSIKDANLKIQATEALFNATLAAFGITETAATLDATNSIINVVWLALGADTKILSVEVISGVDTVIYSDNKISTDKKSDGKTHDPAVIKIDGITYTIGAEDNKGESSILGQAAKPVYGIEVTIDNTTLDKYVPAVADDPATEENEAKEATGGIAEKAIPAYYKATL
jgi:hypothetical protein